MHNGELQKNSKFRPHDHEKMYSKTRCQVDLVAYL